MENKAGSTALLFFGFLSPNQFLSDLVNYGGTGDVSGKFESDHIIPVGLSCHQ